MKNKIKKYYDLIYFFVIFVAIGLSLVYGQILEANIGEYPPYMVFGSPLPLYAIVLIPVLITGLYAYSIYIAYKNSLIDFSNKSIALMISLVAMLFYMITLVWLKDNSHVFGNNLPPNNGPTINERLFSIFTFYLSILMIYAFYALIKRTRNSKLFIELILVGVIIFAISSVIYSLCTEMNKYEVVFSDKFNIFDKETLNGHWITSFYTIGNVFGHTVYVGALAVIFLSILTKKYWISLFSIAFLPFVYASACRASILSSMILYLGLIIYLIIPSFKKSKWVGLGYISLLAVTTLFICLELYVWENLTFSYQGSTYPLRDFVKVVLSRMDSERLSIVEMCYKNSTIRDIVFGFGYGLHLLVPRTHGGYIYYMHNTFVEYVAVGGIFYCVFILSFFVISLYKCLRMNKAKQPLVALFFVMLLSQIVYGMFESIPVLANNFFGAVFGLYFFLIINLEYQEYIGEIDTISTLDPINTDYDLTFEVIDEDDSITDANLNWIVDEIKSEMEKDKIYDLNVVLLGLNESVKMEQNNANEFRRTYKSFYDEKENRYYLLNNKL